MNAAQEIRDDLLKHARKLSLSRDPQLRIEASYWELFFKLPPSRLLELRDQALQDRQAELPLEHSHAA